MELDLIIGKQTFLIPCDLIISDWAGLDDVIVINCLLSNCSSISRSELDRFVSTARSTPKKISSTLFLTVDPFRDIFNENNIKFSSSIAICSWASVKMTHSATNRVSPIPHFVLAASGEQGAPVTTRGSSNSMEPSKLVQYACVDCPKIYICSECCHRWLILA